MMHDLIASAGHTAPHWHLSHTGAIITALVAAALIVAVLKIAGRILSPRKPKPQGRSGLPYAAPSRRR